jgi:hypothetical protein
VESEIWNCFCKTVTLGCDAHCLQKPDAEQYLILRHEPKCVQLRDAQPPQFLRLGRNFVRKYANTPLNGNAASGNVIKLSDVMAIFHHRNIPMYFITCLLHSNRATASASYCAAVLLVKVKTFHAFVTLKRTQRTVTIM